MTNPDVPGDANLYVYGVVLARSAPREAGSGREAIEGQLTETIPHGSLAAVVSRTTSARVRPSRANLLDHERVVSALHRDGPVVPARFGTVMPSRAAVVGELLEPGAAGIERRLRELDGKDEYRLTATYRPEVALREVVAGSREIRRLKAQGKPADRALQMRLGEMVMAGLEQLRDRDEAGVLDRIAADVVAVRLLGGRSDETPVHAALLVDRRRSKRLVRALEEVGDEERDRMELQLVGPLPAWDFSDLDAGAA